MKFNMAINRQPHNAITRATLSEAAILVAELNEPGNQRIRSIEDFRQELATRLEAARQRETHKTKRVGRVEVTACRLSADGRPVLRIRKPNDNGRDIATISITEN